MSIKKKLTPAAIVAVALGLTGCSMMPLFTAQPTPTQTSLTPTATPRADGTENVAANANATLLQTPTLTAVPTWSVNSAKLPKGWVYDYKDDTAGLTDEQVAYLHLQNEMNTPPIYNAENTCFAQATTTFQPSFQVGRGDFYLTKQALYSGPDSVFSSVADEATYQIPQSSGNSISAFGGYIDGSFFSGSSGTSRIGVTAPPKMFVVSRAIDQLMTDPLHVEADDAPPVLSPEQIAEGMQIVAVPTYDKTKGLPTALINVTCTTSEALMALDKQSVLNAFTWNLK